MKSFDLTHAKHLHQPYGLWIVRYRGTVIGRQLSHPNEDDCRRMLRLHREGKEDLQHAGDRLAQHYGRHQDGPEATKAGQRRGGHNRRTTMRLRRK